MWVRSIFLLMALSLCVIFTPAMADTIVEVSGDQTFNSSQWTAVSNPPEGAGGDSIAFYETTGGNSGTTPEDGCLRVTNHVNAGNGTDHSCVGTTAMFSQTFNPASTGGINCVGVSVDAKMVEGFGEGVNVSFVIEQGGVQYVCNLGLANNTTWSQLSSGSLTSDMFSPVGPNFEEGEMTFGLMFTNSTPPTGQEYTVEALFDNFTVTACVPEPVTLSLLVLGGLTILQKRM